LDIEIEIGIENEREVGSEIGIGIEIENRSLHPEFPGRAGRLIHRSIARSIDRSVDLLLDRQAMKNKTETYFECNERS